MFTGLVEEIGCLKRVERKVGFWRFHVEAQKVVDQTRIGDSIAVNGVCLTVTSVGKGMLVFEAIRQTLNASTLRSLKTKQLLNLERAVRVGERLGGHFVTGHVDCVGTIRSLKRGSSFFEIQVAPPPAFLKFVVKKGSIALDGVSLTIADVRRGAFFVNIIPHTARSTTLFQRHNGDQVNIEMDILSKRAF